MKKSGFLFLLLTSVAFASCSDSDDSEKDLAKEIAGQYDGYTVASCAYFSNQVASGQKLSITSTEINKVNVDYASDSWGTISIPDATVVKSGNEYVITGSGTSVMGMQGSGSKDYVCNLNGKIINGTADFTFTCPAVMGGLNIAFMQGEIPAETVVPGTYSGYTKADCAYFQDMYADNQKIEITSNGNNTYKVSLTSETWGEFTIEEATVTTDGNLFKLEGAGKTIMGMGGNVSEYACTFSGEIDADKENPTFTFSVPAVMGGLTVTFKPGTAPQV
ncbi:MAG: calycin-like domain-containing protein [Duncaniella sp.]|nr:calycin-like domain-containing protein [Duncaniella sp.]